MKQVIEVGICTGLEVAVGGLPPMTLIERAFVGHVLGIDPTINQIERPEKVIDFKDARAQLKGRSA